MLLRPKPSGLASLFGALELRVLEVLWERGDEVSVRDVLPHFPKAAYTTVMTTMERLHRKGVLERRKAGRAFLYRPAQSREELESRIIVRTLEPLLNGNAEPVLSCLVEQVTRHDEKLLDELERLVREKRKQQERGR
jgi:predicted transcriptional regulator